MVSGLTMTDLFCGAGGSSSGAESVPGVRVRMAANHWRLAVETHNTNLPHADHDVADISQVDPRRYPATDLLWASPECTNHSQAKGVRRQLDSQPDLFGEVLPDEAVERSRATMWDVARFVEAMQLRGKPYKAFVVENVVDVRRWMYYRSWRLALTDAGYCLHEVYLNSMHAQGAGKPAPQSRDRWYCVGHLSKTPCPDLNKWTRPHAWCVDCGQLVRAFQSWKGTATSGRYRAQYVYRCPNAACRHKVVEPAWLPAAAAIDWTTPGQRIGDRAKPLADKTRARIKAGLARYGRAIHLEAAGNTFERRPGVRTWPADDPFRTIHTTPSKALAYPPLVVELRDSGRKARPAAHPLATVTAAGNHHGLLVPAGGTWNDEARSTAEPFRTRTTRETEGVLFPPAMVMRNFTARGDQGQMSTPTGQRFRTFTASGKQSLITWAAVYGYDTGRLRSTSEVLPTQTTVDGDALLTGDNVPEVDDCYFRMLDPSEIQAAMAFTAAYVVLGKKRERVRQLGNAVTPPAARDLIAAVAESLGHEVDLSRRFPPRAEAV